MNKELIRTATIALIFFGIGAAAAESNLNTFTLRADRVLTDYIGGNATASEVNITGLIIQAGQILGYYNESATDALLDAKANQSDLTAHIGNVTVILDNKYNKSETDALLGGKANASDLTSHTSNSSNPHNVTRGQVGAAASSHGHDASNITSGTIDDSRLPSTMSGKTLTSPTITTPALTLSTSTSTASGRVAYDATSDRIAVGDGTAVDYFYAGDHTTDTDTWITTQTCSADYALQSVGKTSKTCINKVDYSDVAYDVSCTNCITGTYIDETSLSGTASSLTAGYASSAGDADTVDGSHASAFMSSSVEVRFTEWDAFTLGTEFVATSAGIAVISGDTVGVANGYVYITIDKDNAETDIKTYRDRESVASSYVSVTVPFDKGDGVILGRSVITATPVARVYYFGIS